MNTDSAAALQRYADITILSWGLAYALASENPKGLINGALSSEAAARRMDVLGEAEDKMMALPDIVSPAQLTRFRKAKADSACDVCRYASHWKHPVCAQKLAEYFGARAALLEWIESGIRTDAATPGGAD